MEQPTLEDQAAARERREGWKGSLAALLDELTALVQDGRKLLAAETQRAEAERDAARARQATTMGRGSS